MLPRAGDIFWVELDPVAGTEQAGRRPALVLSDDDYHQKSSRAVVCPITSTVRDWPFNVPVAEGLKTTGVVLVDQVRTIHRASLMFDFIETAPSTMLVEVRGRPGALLGIPVAT